MKDKTIRARIGCAAFFLVCLLLSAGVFFPASAGEGRELAPFPALRTEEGGWNGAFFSEFDAWLTDRAALRPLWISAVSTVRERVFGTGSEQVVVGTDGFLFYADTVGDYCGESDMTEAELAAAADALLALSDYAAEHGARLVFAAAPNKNTIYSERMPAVYRRLHDGAHETNMDRLYAALSERGVLYADLREALSGSDTLLYYRRDTHWNGAGALAAYRAILDTAEIPHEDYADVPLTEGTPIEGDLDAMLYPGARKTEQDLVPDVDLSSSFVYTSAYTSPMDMVVTTRGRGEGVALVFRDSFGSALIPYFSAAFAEVRYERSTPYRIELIEQTGASFVLIEIAERNIPQLVAAADRITGER
jgi:hypothetical protein